jgi:hypothetical protein
MARSAAVFLYGCYSALGISADQIIGLRVSPGAGGQKPRGQQEQRGAHHFSDGHTLYAKDRVSFLVFLGEVHSSCRDSEKNLSASVQIPLRWKRRFRPLSRVA